MKPSIKAGLSVVLGLICSLFLLDSLKVDYNLFRDTFVFWKALVKIGTPVLFVLLWYWIIQIASKVQHKR